jgi:hypothetical protein
MLVELRRVLDGIQWAEGEPPPTVDFRLYFEGNNEEECIAPNGWGFGRPSIAQIFIALQAISARSDVQTVLVGLHSDWNDKLFVDGFPPAENVHIYTSAAKSEVELWIARLGVDGVDMGWPYGRPKTAPEPGDGFRVYSVFWD